MRSKIYPHIEIYRTLTYNFNLVWPGSLLIICKCLMYCYYAVTQDIDVVSPGNKTKDEPHRFCRSVCEKAFISSNEGHPYRDWIWTDRFSKNEPTQPEDNRQWHRCQPGQLSPLNTSSPD